MQDEKINCTVAVELQSLNKAYDKVLFKELNLILEAGQKLAVIGPNGAGKPAKTING